MKNRFVLVVTNNLSNNSTGVVFGFDILTNFKLKISNQKCLKTGFLVESEFLETPEKTKIGVDGWDCSVRLSEANSRNDCWFELSRFHCNLSQLEKRHTQCVLGFGLFH